MHTTNFVAFVDVVSLVDISLDLHPNASDAVRLVPVQLRASQQAVVQLDRRESLQLPPSTAPEATLQVAQRADCSTSGNRFNAFDSADQPKPHALLRDIR